MSLFTFVVNILMFYIVQITVILGKQYNQHSGIYEDHVRSDILRDTKTIFAPEPFHYSNNTSREKKFSLECLNSHSNKYFMKDGLSIINQETEDISLRRKCEIPKKKPITTQPPRNVSTSSTKRQTATESAVLFTTQDRPLLWNNQKSSEEIRKIQSMQMKKYMNPDIDPCTDFYEYACGNWKKFYTIPPDRSTYDTFEIVRENLDLVLKQLLEEKMNKSTGKTDDPFTHTNFLDPEFAPNITTDATVKAKNYYKSCMQEDVIERRGYAPLLKIIDELGGWPIINPKWNEKNFDIIWILSRLRILNNDVLIAQWIGPDMKNSNEYVVHIDQTTLGLPAREYYLDESNIKFIRAYKIFITNIIDLMDGTNATTEKQVEEIIDFETQLASIVASSEDRRNISDVYLRTDLASMTMYFPQFDWKTYFSIALGRNVDVHTPVACYCSRYLHEITFLLSYTEPRVLQNYIIWRFVKHRTGNLGKKFLEARQRFYYVLYGREKQPSRWEFCVSQANSNMGMALGALFVQRYFDNDSKVDTIKMTQALEESFKTILEENTWLDSHTKEYARMKIDAIDLKIGFPDFILVPSELDMRYYDVEIHPEYFFENTLSILRHMTMVEKKRLGSVVNRTLWSTPPAVVNAYYSRNKNQIMFPAGILQPPFYHKYFPKALNFGGIGVVIGHEITHGFDDKGRLFDQEGNLHMWWRDTSIQQFYEKSQCMIDQYSQYMLPEIKVALDGYLTQGENIADNGGLKQSFRAYEKWLKDHPKADETLPGIKLDGKQLFFLNFAQVWCGQQRIETAKNRMKSSVHSPGIFRVLGVVSNSQEFSDIFHCPVNSPMNPEKKCRIW